MGAVRVTLFIQAGRLERQWKEETELVQLRQDAKSETDYLQDELLSLRASYEEKMKAYKDLLTSRSSLIKSSRYTTRYWKLRRTGTRGCCHIVMILICGE